MKSRHRFKLYRSAFTLTEILFVSMMIAVLSLSLYRALSIGLKVWDRSRSFAVEEDVMIFLDKLSMDLRNAVPFSLLSFHGTSSEIRFPAIVSVPMGRSSGDVQAYTDQIGLVAYGMELRHQGAFRSQAGYGQALDGGMGPARILAAPIDRLRFEYLSRGMTGVFERQLNRDTLPDSVKVSVYFKNSQGQMQVMTRLIHLPLYL